MQPYRCKITFSGTTMRKHYFIKLLLYTLLIPLLFLVAPCDMKAQVRKLSQRTAAATPSKLFIT
jgi:hypothetical protein